jgi:GT2 family glycosyltransferase
VKLDLSILVVTFNGPAMVSQFHEQLTDSLSSHSDWEVLYHDNTPDTSVLKALAAAGQPTPGVVHDASNPGFAAGVNRLIKRSRFPWVLLLNPDVQGFTPEFWSGLMTRSDPNQVTFIRLLDRDGLMQDCVGRVVSLGRALWPRPDYARWTQPGEIETGIMAFMLVHRTVLDRVGPLDERYFLYAEDMDWCYRAGKLGVRRIFDPRLSLTHLGAQSADTTASRARQLQAKYDAESLFVDKFYTGIHGWLMGLLTRFKKFRARL